MALMRTRVPSQQMTHLSYHRPRHEHPAAGEVELGEQLRTFVVMAIVVQRYGTIGPVSQTITRSGRTRRREAPPPARPHHSCRHAQQRRTPAATAATTRRRDGGAPRTAQQGPAPRAGVPPAPAPHRAQRSPAEGYRPRPPATSARRAGRAPAELEHPTPTDLAWCELLPHRATRVESLTALQE